MAERVLGNLRDLQDAANINKGEALLPLMTGHRKRNYKPLMERPVCGKNIDQFFAMQGEKQKLGTLGAYAPKMLRLMKNCPLDFS